MPLSSSSSGTTAVATDAGRLLAQLRRRLDRRAASAPPHEVCIEHVRSGRATPQHLRRILRDQGVVVVRDAFTPEALAAARRTLAAAYATDVVPQLPVAHRPAAVTPHNVLELVRDKRMWPAGIVGNKGFGFLHAQPEAKDDVPWFDFGGGLRAAVAPCSGYRANLELLAHPTSQLALSTLLAVSENEAGMVSVDSVKMHREEMTKPHVDLYGRDALHRVQAMAIGPGEGSVRLCFARFSHTPAVQRVLARLSGRADFFDTHGFRAFPTATNKALLDVLFDAGVLHAAAPRSLVLWKSGVLHAELQTEGVPRFVHRQKDTSTTTERYVVGTHRPAGLSQEQLTRVGFAADHGFVFHPYNSLNKGTAAGANSFHLKTTQFKRKRPVVEAERRRSAAVATRLLQCAAVGGGSGGAVRADAAGGAAGVGDVDAGGGSGGGGSGGTGAVDTAGAASELVSPPTVWAWKEAQAPAKLHCLGICQRSEDLFTDAAAARVFAAAAAPGVAAAAEEAEEAEAVANEDREEQAVEAAAATSTVPAEQ